MANRVTSQVKEIINHCGGDEQHAIAYLLGQVEYIEKEREHEFKRLEKENERLREILRKLDKEVKPSWI